MSKKNIVLRAPVITQSGYGCHSRQLAKWLLNVAKDRSDLDVTFDIVPWGMTPWYVDPAACDGLIGEIMQRTNKKDVYDVSLQLQLPNEWNPFLAKYNVGLTAGVETDVCNPAWVESINKMDLVVTPSEFTKTCFKNSGDVKTNIEVIPESWVPSVGTAKTRPNKLEEKLKLETDFNFLVVSQFTGNNPENDRKNIAYTIKWFMEQFPNDPNVGVILKTNFGRNTSADRRNVLQIVSQIVMECKKGVGPRVYVLHGHMTDDEIVDLYTHPKVKALVNLARGEGFGLPILEAAASGLPVIVTDWSAHTEFLRQGKYVKVEYNMTPVHQTRVDNQIFMPNAKWANPSEEDFKRKVKRFRDNSSIPKEWAVELQGKLLASHSPEAIEKRYSEVLKDILV